MKTRIWHRYRQENPCPSASSSLVDSLAFEKIQCGQRRSTNRTNPEAIAFFETSKNNLNVHTRLHGFISRIHRNENEAKYSHENDHFNERINFRWFQNKNHFYAHISTICRKLKCHSKLSRNDFIARGSKNRRLKTTNDKEEDGTRESHKQKVEYQHWNLYSK